MKWRGRVVVRGLVLVPGFFGLGVLRGEVEGAGLQEAGLSCLDDVVGGVVRG